MSIYEYEHSVRLLTLVQQLLAIEETRVPEALERAATLLASALSAEKVDVFLYEPESQSLVAQGISQTALGRREHAIGMDRLPLANGGRGVQVFQTGTSYHSGQVERDPQELVGIKEGLSIRSVMAVPLVIGGQRRGVLQADSTQPDFFREQDERLFEAVAHWVGTVAHRAELLQQVAQAAAEQARRGTAEELLVVFAHDVRNYLTPLYAHLGLLQRRASRQQRQNDLADLAAMTSTLNRLERLISDLMDTARLSQGLFTLIWQTFDLVSLVQETATILQTPFVPIEVQAPELLFIRADADRVRQALENLLANALSHAPQGTRVLILVQPQDEGTQVLLSISDQGPGISQDVLSTLFEPFRAGAGSTGLGLGLYLARQIALAHGGEVRVDTTYQQGARFLFSLPTHCPQAELEALPDTDR